MFTLPVPLFLVLWVVTVLLVACSFVAIRAATEPERRVGVWVAVVFVLLACLSSLAAGLLQGAGTPLGSRFVPVKAYQILSVAATSDGYAVVAVLENRPMFISIPRERVVKMAEADEAEDQRLEPLDINQWRLVYKSPMNTSLVLELRDKP